MCQPNNFHFERICINVDLFFVLLDKEFCMKTLFISLTGIIAGLLILNSCKSIPSNTKAIKKMSFLQGEWSADMDGIPFTEKYIQKNDSTISGESKLLNEGEELYTELITIAPLNGKLYYKSSFGQFVVEQGKILPLTRITKKSVTFGKVEKGQTYLIYTLKKDGLLLEMQDNADGIWMKEKYLLKKKNGN